jgi:hypothetical protein
MQSFCLHSRSRNKRDNRSAATFSPLKKFASHFFNHACGVTGEKEAANPVTGKKYNQVFNGFNNFRLLLLANNTFCNCKFL